MLRKSKKRILALLYECAVVTFLFVGFLLPAIYEVTVHHPDLAQLQVAHGRLAFKRFTYLARRREETREHIVFSNDTGAQLFSCALARNETGLCEQFRAFEGREAIIWWYPHWDSKLQQEGNRVVRLVVDGQELMSDDTARKGRILNLYLYVLLGVVCMTYYVFECRPAIGTSSRKKKKTDSQQQD